MERITELQACSAGWLWSARGFSAEVVRDRRLEEDLRITVEVND